MDSTRARTAMIRLVPKVVGLLLFGIGFEAVMGSSVEGTPRPIYATSSFTLAFLARIPWGLGIALAIASAGFTLWLFIPSGRGHLGWASIDRGAGLRWLILVVGMTLGWAYAGHPYNYYFDQSHVWDRWLIVGLMIGMLRSPFLIPFFVFEVVLSRGQFVHPLSTPGFIGDELPIRVLGIIVGCALWNGLIDGLMADRFRSRMILLQRTFASARIPMNVVVYSVLCLIGFYYCVAGFGKLMLGAELLDWMRYSHMENLFVASHLNGWLYFLPEARILELADTLRILHLPIAVMTLVIELGMGLVLVRQRGTLLFLTAVSAMHVGIVASSGIIFWKWLVLDLSLLVWLWLRREDQEIKEMYSTSNLLLSILVIGGLVAGFQTNRFAWWNTKWTMVDRVEVVDEEGNLYLVAQADFTPYAFFDTYKPEDRVTQTFVYGATTNQHLLNFFEEADPDTLKKFSTSAPGLGVGPAVARKARSFNDFMERYFRNRNARPGQRVAPFLLPPPSRYNGYPNGPNIYRDQSPVVEVRLRFQEFYYTGSELRRMRDQIVYSIPIQVPKTNANQ